MFPFNWFPLREGNINVSGDEFDTWFRFPFNWFPLREGNRSTYRNGYGDWAFPFNWFPLREGNLGGARGGLAVH